MTEKDKLKILYEEWLPKVFLRAGDFKDYAQLIEDKEDEKVLRFVLYTERCSYNIVAIDRKGKKGYLGCTMSLRMPYAGENHTRGRDLPDGAFNKDTWDWIISGIVGNELVQLSEWIRNPPPEHACEAEDCCERPSLDETKGEV